MTATCGLNDCNYRRPHFHDKTIAMALVPCGRCTGLATTTIISWQFGVEWLCGPCAVNVRRDRTYSGTNDEQETANGK